MVLAGVRLVLKYDWYSSTIGTRVRLVLVSSQPLRRASQPSVKGFLPPSGCRGLQNAAITVTVDIAFALPQRLFESCCRQLLWVQAAYLTIYCMKLVKLGWQYTPPPHLHRNRALAPYNCVATRARPCRICDGNGAG